MSKTIFTVTWQQQSFRFPCLQTYALLMILVAAVQQHRKKERIQEVDPMPSERSFKKNNDKCTSILW
jgi:hypothetical protein